MAGNGTQGYSGDGGAATAAKLFQPSSTVIDPQGNLLIADANNYVIRKIDHSGIITTIAGTGVAGYSGDGGPATLAKLYGPVAMIFDTVGNLYLTDPGNGVIRKIDTNGIITTFAGNGSFGCSGDSGAALSAAIGYTSVVAVDSKGNIYLSQHTKHVIRRIDPQGIITTIAGVCGFAGFNGDSIPAKGTKLSQPYGLFVDKFDNLYIADIGNQRIRKIDASGIITTVAGNGTAAYAGNGVPATTASLYNPMSVTKDKLGNLYIADSQNNRVRKVDSAGIITDFAGNGLYGYTGDGGAAINATMYGPVWVMTDSANNVYITDQVNNVIRKVTVAVGVEQLISAEQFYVYPNPASEVLQIELPNNSSKPNMQIENLMGEVLLVQEMNDRQTQVHVSDLAEGVYFVRLKTSVGTLTKRIMIAR